MKREQPQWLDKNLFPFESKWIDIDGDFLHYVDEGEGKVILFAHGTPEWSFGYRDLIKSLSQKFRCVAIDMLGFGLSDKRADADYTCRAHAQRLASVIEKLNLQDITIVANDFGGSIALAYAIRNPGNIRTIALFNTWMWSLKDDKHFAGPAKIARSWFGRFLYLRLNAPVNFIMPAAFGDKTKLTRNVHAHYKQALQKGDRQAAFTFAKELLDASEWWQTLWDQADVLKGKSILIFWGMKDKFILPKELEKWKSKFPAATIIPFDDAGHFVQEEKAAEMSKVIEKVLTIEQLAL
jgi:pimeloyl-ACP methyl ester carboxylesterase